MMATTRRLHSIALCVIFLLKFCTSLDNNTSTMTPTITKQIGVPIAVLLPNSTKDGKCTNQAIQMAIDDVNTIKNFIVQQTGNSTDGLVKTSYKLEPYYGETLETVGDAIEALHSLYKNKTKISTIGPPYKDQNEYITEYTTANANMHISYSEANEPMESYFIMHFRTPPSISSSFLAAKSLLKNFDWSRTGMIYDYSDLRYRKNVDKLRDIISSSNDPNSINDIVADQGIWSIPVQYSVSKELGVLQDKGVRIVLTLVSVSGARKLFCEAYHRKMYRPKVIWILFETLPEDWASNKYDAWTTKNNNGYNMEREIKCTEEELLTAADGYISLTKQGLRRDNRNTISNMTADDFRARLQQAVGNDVHCEENVAYAYDAIWVLAKGYQSIAQQQDIMNYKYHDFQYTITLAEQIRKLKFEALTGPLMYARQQEIGHTRSRIGQLTLWVNHKGEQRKYFGTHDTVSDTLKLIPDVKNIVFKSGIIPKDRAIYTITNENFDEALMIVMWLLSLLGILMALVFLVASIVLMKYRYSVLDTPIVDCVLLTGSILCYLSVIIYGVDTRYVSKGNIPKTCTAFLTILSIGFTLAFGSLFAKTWKVYKLYMTPEIKVENNKQQEKEEVAEWILLAMVASLVVGDAILLTCWSVTAPFENQIYNATTNSSQFENVIEIKQIIRCKCDNQTQFTIGVYCYKGLLLIFGLFLAWQTRNAKLKCKSDSKQISMAIYNVVAVSIIGVICVTVLANTTRQQAMFAILAVCIIICTTTTLLLVFLNKMRRAIRGDHKELQMDANRSISGGKESPQTKYTLEYMRKPVGSLDVNNRQISTHTLNTQISTESPTSVHYTKYGTSPGVSSVVSMNPTYLHSSPFMAPPDYSELSNSGVAGSSLRSGIYVGSISEEDDEITADLSSKESNETVESSVPI